ncbi:MipA/OmpV family protein [Aestuariibius sp. 2305UL40-4]|uniref:MipA/OmpV family protein n=1 Tax=Aestuariibius violaceus TaxID=3234132 RepID=UPI00345E36F4
MRIATFLAVILGAAPSVGVAQTDSVSGNGVTFSIGVGAESRPEYFGSDENEVEPRLSFRMDELRLGTFGSGGNPENGLGFRGSVRLIGERDSDEFDELDGLDDVDQTIELGLGLVYRQPGYEVFADVRRGFGGHESVVGEVGADAIFTPSNQLEWRFGPRVFIGSDEYAETYFGVSEDEAAASDFDAFDAEGGVLSAGLELGMTYQFNERWAVDGAVGYDRFLGDAADSPIVEEGSDEQYTARLGLMRTFSFGF